MRSAWALNLLKLSADGQLAEQLEALQKKHFLTLVKCDESFLGFTEHASSSRIRWKSIFNGCRQKLRHILL